MVIGCDHGGFDLKEQIKEVLEKKGFSVEDMGAKDFNPEDDYPCYTSSVARKVADGTFERGVVVCGSGIGASITANRFAGVRAALCLTPEMATLSRSHNDSNVLALGGRITPGRKGIEILEAWLDGAFKGGRHERRIRDIESCTGEC
ncbi:MAG: ribose 5-phosphate isomerase B [Chitinivibrionales bacterium]|nr:ribose 5-phosphate isomerase B [Chitinivibrionales bacterium]